MLINEITYPKKYSEFEIQSEVYQGIRSLTSLDVRGAVLSWCDDGGKIRRVFLDLVVFKEKKAVAIIECKNHTKSRKRVLGKRQTRRYGKFMVPVICCFTMDDVLSIVEIVRGL